MKKIRSQKGYTGIDIAISVIVIFIFVSLITMLIYNFNSSADELKIKSDATYIAVNEIEKIKSQDFSEFLGMDKTTTVDKNGKSLVNQPVEGNEGFYKTTTILDYKDVNGDASIEKDIVKKVTVKISYMYKGKERSVQLSTILSKER